MPCSCFTFLTLKYTLAGTISRDCAVYSTTPSQTVELIAKVEDVADIYLQTLQVAGAVLWKEEERKDWERLGEEII